MINNNHACMVVTTIDKFMIVYTSCMPVLRGPTCVKAYLRFAIYTDLRI